MRGLRIAAFLLLCSAAAFAADYLGPEACKACHPDAYAAWSKSKHARSLEVLSPREQKDARCQSCHAPDLAETGVSEVTCETCHGGGRYYGTSYVMKDSELARLVGLKDPSEKTCRTCHDDSSPSLQPFDFKSKLMLIDHWTKPKPEPAPANAPVTAAKPR